jgi:hypothetical protein
MDAFSLGGTFERRKAKVLACRSRFMERRNIAIAMVTSEITKYFILLSFNFANLI